MKHLLKNIEGFLKEMFQAERGFHEGRPEGKSLEERKALLDTVHAYCLNGVQYHCAVDDPTGKKGALRSPMTCMFAEEVKAIMLDEALEPDDTKDDLPRKQHKASPSAQWSKKPSAQK